MKSGMKIIVTIIIAIIVILVLGIIPIARFFVTITAPWLR